MLSLCIGCLWTQQDSIAIQAGIYVDDRVLWMPRRHNDAHRLAQQALQRIDQFNKAARLLCKVAKCHLVLCDPACSWHEVAKARGCQGGNP